MSSSSGSFSARLAEVRGRATALAPGLLVSAVLAIAAQFISDHYGAPAMLMALLLGMALSFLAEEGRCVPGIEFSGRSVLRLGVALLGARISFDLLAALGWEIIALVVFGVIATVLFGLIGARLLGRGWRLALLTSGSVAICGASAAMAIAAVLPKNAHSERNLIFTVLSVTVLSTLAMIAYPLITGSLALDDRAAGIFLGATIHDVAQVVGAGFSVSEEAGENATLVKLIRVSLLAPMVLVFGLVFLAMGIKQAADGKRPPLIPGFILAFLALATLNSFQAIPEALSDELAALSRWALLTAIAAVGMKTSLRRIRDVGGQAIVLIVAETLFLAALILAGLLYLA